MTAVDNAAVPPRQAWYDRRDGRIIVQRAVQLLVSVTVAGPIPHTLAPDHPMVDETCQVCGRPLGAELPVTYVVIGIAPEDRVDDNPRGMVNAAVVVVHAECTGPTRFWALPD